MDDTSIFPPVGTVLKEDEHFLKTIVDEEEWYKDGKLYMYKEREKIVWINGDLTREDYNNGIIHWRRNNHFHRINGPAKFTPANIMGNQYDTEEWYINGLRHRDTEPAVISGPFKQWWYHGLLNRLDGPAIDYFTRQEWYVLGQRMPFNSTSAYLMEKYTKLHRKEHIDEIGSGTYGCVYNQELSCINDAPPCNNKKCVTKRFKLDDAYMTEIDRNNLINDIDPDGQYHFRMLGNCDSSRIYDISSGCRSPSENPPLIYYEKGEESLTKIINHILKTKSHEDFYKMLIGLKNLFEGLVKFKTFIHHDIKTDNIVQDETGKYKFIDFGMAINYNKIRKSAQIIFYKAYPYWPPEIFYLAYAQGFIPTDDELWGYTKRYYRTAIKYQKLRYQPTAEEIYRILQKQRTVPFNITKLDIFAMGIILNVIRLVAEEIDAPLPSRIHILVEKTTAYSPENRWLASEADIAYAYFVKELEDFRKDEMRKIRYI